MLFQNLDEKHRLQNLSVHRFNKEPYLPVEYEESSNSNILSVSNKNKLPPDKLTRLQLEDLDFVPPCDIHVKEAISSIYRAKTQQCKQMIANVTCLIINNQLYPRSLPHLCPTGKIKNFFFFFTPWKNLFLDVTTVTSRGCERGDGEERKQ